MMLMYSVFSVCDIGSLTLIDLEYGGPNYRGFDLGDFFCEFAGKHEYSVWCVACVCVRARASVCVCNKY